MDIRRTLAGGDPRSLGSATDVLHAALGDRSLLPTLVDCLLDHDPVVRMRAADALEKVCRREPQWLVPYVDRLLVDVATIDQPSVRWHVAQMLAHVPLADGQRRRALAVLEQNLAGSSDWLVLNHSLESLGRLARQDDKDLAPSLHLQLSRLERYRQYSVARRAARVRRHLEPAAERAG